MPPNFFTHLPIKPGFQFKDALAGVGDPLRLSIAYPIVQCGSLCRCARLALSRALFLLGEMLLHGKLRLVTARTGLR